MKKTISIVLALVMLLAMFATVGAAESPEALEAEAAQTELAEETASAPETVSAPVPEVPAEPEANETEADETEVSETEADETEASETEVGETEEEPADNGIATAAELPAENDALTTVADPEPTPLPTVDVHTKGGYFPAPRSNYEKLTVTLQDGKLPDTKADSYAEPGWYTPQRDGWKFLGWYDPKVGDHQLIQEGESVNGAEELWAKWEKLPRSVTLDANPGYFLASDLTGKGYVTFLPAGSAPYDTTNIKVALTGSALPGDLPDPVLDGATDPEKEYTEKTHWTFAGWYTGKPSVTKEDVEGGWRYKSTPSGVKVEKGYNVPEGVSTLYAYWTPDETLEGTTLITFKLNWNGMFDKTASLICTRSYGSQFTAEDALVIGLNYKADSGETFDMAYKGEGQVTWANLQQFWDSNTFGGYTFKGWYTKPAADDEGCEKVDRNWTVTDGMIFYAHWEKKNDEGKIEEESDSFNRTDPAAGPLTGLRILGELDSSMSASVHAGKGTAFTLSLLRSPVRAEAKNVTWNVTVVKAASNPIDAVIKSEKQTLSVTADETKKTDDGGIELKAEGLNLTITCVEGEAYSVTVTATADDKDGVKKSADSAATVSFYHSAGTWALKEEPTCIKSGTETTKCTVCGQELTRKVVPLEHQWKLEVTKVATCTTAGLAEDACARCGVTFEQYQTGADKDETPPDAPQVLPATGHSYTLTATNKYEAGVRLLNKECEACHDTETIKNGDLTGDNNITNQDIFKAFNYISMKDTAEPADVQIGDVTGDGAITNQDIFAMFNYISMKTNTLG